MSDAEQTEDPGPASGLMASLARVLSTLVGIAQTRLELLSTELQQEVAQAVELLLWAFVALIAVGMGLFLGALVLIFAFWDTHRVLVAVLIMVFYLALALTAFLVLRAKFKGRGQLFGATIAEFAKDREYLKARR